MEGIYFKNRDVQVLFQMRTLREGALPVAAPEKLVWFAAIGNLEDIKNRPEGVRSSLLQVEP